jgi:hypothetical protein
MTLQACIDQYHAARPAAPLLRSPTSTDTDGPVGTARPVRTEKLPHRNPSR